MRRAAAIDGRTVGERDFAGTCAQGTFVTIPPIIFRGRDAIEGLVPRDSSISAVVHLAMGVGAATSTIVGGSMLFPRHADAKPGQLDRDQWMSQSRTGLMVLSAGPLFLTAGHQLATDAGKFLKGGVSPMYFLAAGALLGAGFIAQPVGDALRN